MGNIFTDIALTLIAVEYAIIESEFELNEIDFNQIVTRNRFIGEITKKFFNFDFLDESILSMEVVENAVNQCLYFMNETNDLHWIFLNPEINAFGVGFSLSCGRLTICICVAKSQIEIRYIQLTPT